MSKQSRSSFCPLVDLKGKTELLSDWLRVLLNSQSGKGCPLCVSNDDEDKEETERETHKYRGGRQKTHEVAKGDVGGGARKEEALKGAELETVQLYSRTSGGGLHRSAAALCARWRVT